MRVLPTALKRLDEDEADWQLVVTNTVPVPQKSSIQSWR